jgi:hypothetical protein
MTRKDAKDAKGMINDYAVDWGRWGEKKPMGISGCFRLRDESEFMEAAILSHLPYLDEAVLVVQPSMDDTVEIAERLEREHPGKVRVEYYPYEIDWIDTPGFYEKDPEKPGHLVHLSNWAFSVCNYAWIAKIEGDVIGLSSFERIVEAVRRRPERRHYYGRVVLNVAGEGLDEFSVKHPRNAGWDECVCPNDPVYSFTRQGKFESLFIGDERTCMGWSGLHMKRCKQEHVVRLREIETWAAFEPENVQAALEHFNRGMPYVGIDNPLGEACLYEKEWIEWLRSA